MPLNRDSQFCHARLALCYGSAKVGLLIEDPHSDKGERRQEEERSPIVAR